MEYLLVVYLSYTDIGFSVYFDQLASCLAAKELTLEYPYETEYHDMTTLRPYGAECYIEVTE